MPMTSRLAPRAWVSSLLASPGRVYPQPFETGHGNHAVPHEHHHQGCIQSVIDDHQYLDGDPRYVPTVAAPHRGRGVRGIRRYYRAHILPDQLVVRPVHDV